MTKYRIENSSQSEAAKPSNDQSEEVIANCDNLGKAEITLSQHDIEKLIVSFCISGFHYFIFHKGLGYFPA